MTHNKFLQHLVDGVAKFRCLLITGTRLKFPANNFAIFCSGNVTGQGAATTWQHFVPQADHALFTSIVATLD
jgi:hypothetical protein